MQRRTQTLGAHRFALRTWGDPGLPTLLMLHGFPEYSGAWEDLAPRLADRFHCIAPDQRGYGGSYAPQGVEAYAMPHLVADMVALIGDTGPVSVMGHDWGASVAYALAINHPHLVGRLIIANGVHPICFQRALARGGAQAAASQYIHALRKEGSELRLAADDFAQITRLFSANMDTRWLRGARLEAYKAAWRQSGLRGMVNWYRASPLIVGAPGVPFDLPAFPEDRFQVRCPHLLIWGEADTALLPEATEGLERFAPDLTRVTVPGADHWLLHQEPARVAALVRDWLGP